MWLRKKYKRWHLGTKDELMDHHKVHISKHQLRSKNRFAGYSVLGNKTINRAANCYPVDCCYCYFFMTSGINLAPA